MISQWAIRDEVLPAVELPQIEIVDAMFVASIASWSAAPSRIAVDFGISGNPDRYGGKVEGLLLIPIIAAAVHAGGYFLP